MKTRSFSKLIGVAVSVAVIGGVSMLSGCGTGGGPNPELQAANVKKATQMRAYFDKVHGDYAQLSDADKASFVELAGGQTKADAIWAAMKSNGARADTSSANSQGGASQGSGGAK